MRRQRFALLAQRAKRGPLMGIEEPKVKMTAICNKTLKVSLIPFAEN